MAQGTWTQTFASLIEHTKARGSDVNARISGLGSNYDMLPAPHDDGKKGFFEPCYVGEATALGHSSSVTDVRNGAITHGIESGAANAYVVTMGISSTAYVVGMRVSFVATNTNTGASTVDVDGLGAIAIKAASDIDLPADALRENDIVDMVFGGTFFQVTSVTSHVASAAVSAAEANASASAAADSETESASSEAVCLASSNFIGNWADQTGAHVVPTSVLHDGSYWMLVADVVDITASEPGVTADWAEINAGVVETVTGTADEIDIDSSDPANLVVSISSGFITELPKVANRVTGNMQGLEYSYNDDDTINVLKGNCYDSENSTLLTLSADTIATIASHTINTVYSIFLTDAGDIQFDTDSDGATLLAGSVNQLRWLGLVKTNSTGSGEIIPFKMVGRRLHFLVPDGTELATNLPGNPPLTAFSISDSFPSERFEEVTLQAFSGHSQWYISIDGTTYESNGSCNGTDTANWRGDITTLLNVNTFYAHGYSNNTLTKVCLHGALLRR